jgi:hypothetical protein
MQLGASAEGCTKGDTAAGRDSRRLHDFATVERFSRRLHDFRNSN